ncbi:MAG: chemotaxis protein CheA [Acidobacteria bacterium]|nr:chemotaxis protein CheA [Acidobacteriota bacterium]
MDPILREFLDESREDLERVDRDLVALESSPGDAVLVDRIFRAIHTIKGTCSFLGLSRLEALSHVGEELLARLRAVDVSTSPWVVPLLLELVDTTRRLLTAIEREGSDEGAEIGDLAGRLAEAARRLSAGSANEPVPAAPGADEGLWEETGTIDGGGPDQWQRETEAPPEPLGPRYEESFVRVDVRVLDRLTDLVGELVLSRNQLLDRGGSKVLEETIEHLDHTTGELQEGIMQTRLQPVGRVWGRFPRLVRDLAAGCGKRVVLRMEGRETELDRGLIEAIRDPLTHLVRNAVDHGIEAPAERSAAGKNPEGTIWLRAFHESGNVIIEVEDDGTGIDPEEIREAAIRRGVLPADRAAALETPAVLELIFAPGFSTSERVTSVSGRGVGLDVVRTNVGRLNGQVEVRSTPGQGTTFRLKIPLTLAILRALIVTAGEERFALAQAAVRELVGLNADAAAGHGIELLHGVPVHRLRGRLLPLVRLGKELGLAPGGDGKGGVIVVLDADERPFGLVVDAVLDTQEIVVKPIGPILERLPVYAGATIMGDGRVTLILDVLGLARRAHLEVDAEAVSGGTDETPPGDAAAPRESYLVFRSPDDGRMAVPLENVVRLDKVPREAIERVGDGFALQYQGDLLPVVYLLEHVEERRSAPRIALEEPDDLLDLLLYSDAGRTVGLVIGRVVDIVEQPVEIRRPSTRANIVECIVLADRITELVDVEAVVRQARPPIVTGPPPAPGGME